MTNWKKVPKRLLPKTKMAAATATVGSKFEWKLAAQVKPQTYQSVNTLKYKDVIIRILNIFKRLFMRSQCFNNTS